MTNRTLTIALICCGFSATCAHRRGYELGEYHVDVGDDHTLLVWDTRPPICCMPMVPVLQIKPSKVTTAEGPCFDGLYNPDRVPLTASAALVTVQLFVLCPEGRPGDDPAVFRMELRTPSGEQHLVFSVVRSTRGGAEIATADGPHGRVVLPDRDVALRRHPEVLGTLFAIGLLEPREDPYRLER